MRSKLPTWRWFALFDKEEEDDSPPPGSGGGGAGAHDRAAAGLTALKARYGNDLERALTVLYDENYTLRDKNRKLREASDKAKLPEGARVITKEEDEELTAYRKVGKPDAIVPKSELDEVNGKLNQVSLERIALAAAGTLGYEPTVLTDLVRDKALHVEVKDEVVDGKAKKTYMVRPAADDKAELKPLDKYMEANHASYLPALKVKPQGVTFPAQGATEGTGGAPTTTVDKYIERRNKAAAARPNPLAPPVTTATE